MPLSNRTPLYGYLFRRGSYARMKGRQDWGFRSLSLSLSGVDDSITNYRLSCSLFFSFLFFSPSLFLSFFFHEAWKGQRFIAASALRSYIYVNCHRAFCKAVNCKIRHGIRLHLLVTRLCAFLELTYRVSPLIRWYMYMALNKWFDTLLSLSLSLFWQDEILNKIVSYGEYCMTRYPQDGKWNFTWYFMQSDKNVRWGNKRKLY